MNGAISSDLEWPLTTPTHTPVFTIMYCFSYLQIG